MIDVNVVISDSRKRSNRLRIFLAGERKKKAPHDTKEIHRKQPKARTATAKNGGGSQATNERGEITNKKDSKGNGYR